MLLEDDKADQEGRRKILQSTCSLASQSYRTGCSPKPERFLEQIKKERKEETEERLLLPEAWISRGAWLMCIQSHLT